MRSNTRVQIVSSLELDEGEMERAREMLTHVDSATAREMLEHLETMAEETRQMTNKLWDHDLR
jgi:predicted Zn-ribbon and HTH transcriptional regulator